MKIKRVILLILAVFMITPVLSLYADTDVNVDGGGGGTGGDNVSGNSLWSDGSRATGDGCPGEAIRVSVINTETKTTVGHTVDFTNINWTVRQSKPAGTNSTDKIEWCTSGRNKLSYFNDKSITLERGTSKYNYWYNPPIPVPPIIKSEFVTPSIDKLRAYFRSEKIIERVADQTGVQYDQLISGKFKIMIEPVVYLTYKGNGYALSATELAILDEKMHGALRSKFLSISHQNLPFAMYLSVTDNTFPEIAPWNGSTSVPVSNDTIYHNLGVGLISFKEDLDLNGCDYVYTCDTDVITSVDLTSASDIGVDFVTDYDEWDGSPVSTTGGGATVEFEIMGNIYKVEPIYMPGGSSQKVWVKWHTPMEPQQIEIPVRVEGATVSNTTILADIVELKENTPPDPTAARSEQRRDFVIPNTYSNVDSSEVKSDSWSVYRCKYCYDWQYEVVDTIIHYVWEEYAPGRWRQTDKIDYVEEVWDWVDYGSYDWGQETYSISIKTMADIEPDDMVPYKMRSGYGIKIAASCSVTGGNYSSDMIGMTPNMIVTFPEFEYTTFNRLLIRDGQKYRFKNNKYSTYNRPAHYTPLWFPDGEYRVLVNVQDVWTSNGQIRLQASDSVLIQGNLYDDYYVHAVEDDR